ncbi:MAG: ABC transporter ATP-binding protein/permease [Firmicutes bacterium]|nr:ABC transporter ATP-binding protein/permease [Bacillota bacterium]
MFKRFLNYYKPYRRIFILDMLSSFFVSLIGVTYPIVTRRMLNEFIPGKMYRMIVFSGLMLAFLYTIRMLLRYYIQYKGHIMGVGMQADMRRDMFNHLEKLSFGFFDNNETGKLMSRLTNDLMDISELAHHGPENLIISGITVIVSFIYLSTINFPLTLIIFLCVPFLVWIAMAMRTRMHRAFSESRKSIAVINASIEGSISGIRVTKAFNNSKIEEKKFDIGNEQFVNARKSAYKAMGIFHSTTSFITDIFNVLVLIAGGFFLYAEKINFGDYGAFIVSVNLFLTPVTTLINFMEQFQDGVSGFERFCEIMDTEPEFDSPDAHDLKDCKGHIEFRNVSYGYEDGENVIKNLSLDIPAGKKLALVGPSGGGKTTICHLIPHFYDTKRGEIFIDSNEIHSLTLSSLRDAIGIVQQDVYLFNSSIKENIAYGKPGATDAEIIEAAKKANIHDYIMSLKDGYDARIGERGVKLSGGQKQRISIARIFLKNPPILILDEATSALDNTTEILIQDALEELCRGRTTIVVAHRLSTIKNADEIAVIAGGKIIEKGTHSDLIALSGIYEKLYNLQFKAKELETIAKL